VIHPTSEQVVRLAAVIALLALACMSWSLLDPRPIPIMVAMSVGQGLGTLSLVLYGVVVIVEARRAARAAPPPDTDRAEDRPGEERDA
jgi:multidrug transporter EmrE-like cation transporter